MGVTQHRYEVEGWGVGEIWVRDGVLVLHELPGPVAALFARGGGHGQDGRRAGPPRGGSSPPEVTLSGDLAEERDGLVPELCRRFRAHLEGRPTDYADVEIDLAWFSPFQADLVRALRGISWGEVVTYGELAALAGRPGAARAAGSFCARNPFALVLPCHRVVAAGGIGGYGPSGVPLKRRLLALEGVRL